MAGYAFNSFADSRRKLGIEKVPVKIYFQFLCGFEVIYVIVMGLVKRELSIPLRIRGARFKAAVTAADIDKLSIPLRIRGY